MANCPMISDCSFFQNEMADKPDIVSKSLKLRFCQGSNTQCARWLIQCALDGKGMPADLYPNQMERVAQIIENYKEVPSDGTDQSPPEFVRREDSHSG